MTDREAAITLRDVTLRDGLQNEPPISTDAKMAIYQALVAAGIRELELTSFVRPDRVPAMADAEQFTAATGQPSTPTAVTVQANGASVADAVPAGQPGSHGSQAPTVTRWGLVLNCRGAQRALDAGLRHLQYVISVSETHSVRNAGVTPDQALVALGDVVDLTAPVDAIVEVTLATAFGCPYEHRVAPQAVVAAAQAAVAAGATSIGLADTIGVAIPPEVRSLIQAVSRAVPVPLGVHLHDTRGLGVTNALAALEEGVHRIDGSVGALGGCPFAPGATGNLALEDLAHVLDESGVNTGVSVDGLIEAAQIATAAVGQPVRSHVGAAGRRFRPVLPHQ